MPHTPGPYQLVILDEPLSDWTGARFVIRQFKHAPGGVAVIIGGVGEQEERANALLFQKAPELLAALREAAHPEPFTDGRPTKTQLEEWRALIAAVTP